MTRQDLFVEFDVTKMSPKGNGMASWYREDKVQCHAEVAFAIPGDMIKAHLVRKERGLYSGVIAEIIQPSNDRVIPRCQHVGTCGGCRWQQMSYAAQLKYKESIIHKLITPHKPPEIDIRPIIGCEEPWQYRNKMEFSFSEDRQANKFLGLMMDHGRGKVVPLQECHLVRPWFIEALHTVRQWWENSDLQAYHLTHNTGSLRTVTMREGMRTGDRLIMLTVSGNPDYALKRQHLDTFINMLKEAQPSQGHLSIFLRIHQIAKGRPTQFYEMQLYGPEYIHEVLFYKNASKSICFNISPTAFFQPNTIQAEVIYNTALQMLPLAADSVVYDLYCGTGALGLWVAPHVARVIGIELAPESVLDARENAKTNGLENIQIIQGDVGIELKKLQDQGAPKPDVVIVDPARPGLDPKAIEHILQLKPKYLLYVSCNPTTQATNIAEFVKNGYRIQIVQPIDQFPHTLHMENLILLKNFSLAFEGTDRANFPGG